MRGLKTRGFENTVPDTVFCDSRNVVPDGVLAMERRLWCEGEYKIRPYKSPTVLEPMSLRSDRCESEHKIHLYKNGVYLEHEIEDVVRLTGFVGPNFKFGMSWGTIPMLENLWLEGTI